MRYESVTIVSQMCSKYHRGQAMSSNIYNTEERQVKLCESSIRLEIRKEEIQQEYPETEAVMGVELNRNSDENSRCEEPAIV